MGHPEPYNKYLSTNKNFALHPKATIALILGVNVDIVSQFALDL